MRSGQFTFDEYLKPTILPLAPPLDYEVDQMTSMSNTGEIDPSAVV